MNEEEWLGILERMEVAMCIYPFHPQEQDVARLLAETARLRIVEQDFQHLVRLAKEATR